MTNMSRLDGIQLHLLNREVAVPLQLDVAASGIHTGEGAVLVCRQILRFLPQRRLVCLAEYEGQRVIAKLFIHPDKSASDYAKELAGNKYLHVAKVLTPELLTSGSLNNAGFYVLYEYIYNSTPLQDNISSLVDDHAIQCLQKLLPVIAQMHNAGIQQGDLHLNNFLLTDKELYTIDCGDVVKLNNNNGANTRQIYKNLADILSQLPIIYDRLLGKWLCIYQAASHLHYHLHKAELCQVINEWRSWRIKKYLKKSARNCSEFMAEKTRDELRVCRRECSNNDWQVFYAQLDALVESSSRLKDGNTATVAMNECAGRKLVIKRYNIKSFRHWMSRCWRPSRGWKSWQNAHRLKVLGIKTPRPIAVIEERFGWLRYRAYFVSEYEPAIDALSMYYQKDEVSAQHLEDFNDLFIAMMYAKMSHGDLKANNILLTEKGLSLIDLDAMKFHRQEKEFIRAFERDCQRFLRNWRPESRVYRQFKVLINNLPVKPVCG